MREIHSQKSFAAVLCLLAALLSAGTASAQLSIYHDGLGAGWSDWSWSATVDLSNTSPVYDGSRSIAVTLSAAWGALSLHRSAIAAGEYDTLEFYIHGGNNNSLDLLIYAEDDDTSTAFTELSLNNTNYIEGGTVSSGQWKRVRIPMPDLNITTPTFTRLSWKDATGGAQPTFYLDDISLVTEFTITALPSAPDALAVQFLSQTNSYFQSWVSESLTADAWTVTNMALGSGGTQVITNRPGDAERLYYKLLRISRIQSWDYDGDGLTDVYELEHLPLNPASPFSDADALPDGWEIGYSLSPTNATGENGDDGDPDADGRDNLTEYNSGTNPRFHERTEAPLYLDYTTGPWDNWTLGAGASRDMQNTEQVYADEYAMKINLTQQDDLLVIGQRHGNAGSTTVGFTNLEFWINGGPNSGQAIYLGVRVGTNTFPGGVSLGDYTNVQSYTWSLVSIPLQDIGADNVTNLTQVFLKNTNSTGISTFWIDNMRLVALWPTTTPVVAVSAANPVGKPVTRRLFGMNVATWDGIFTNAATLSLMQEAGLTLLRYPGGSIADQYGWLNNTNKTADNHPYPVDTETFLIAANALGAEKNITVNYGSGSAQEAADWVDHVYNTLNRTAEWWCVGNECYGSWEYDTNSPSHDAVEYAARWIQYRDAMKAVEPTIKVGIVGTHSPDDWTNGYATVTNPVTATTHEGWTAVLLNELSRSNAVPDFYELHYYGYSLNTVPNIPPERADDYALLESAESEAVAYREIREMLCDYFGPTNGSNVMIHITENNCQGYDLGKQSVSLVNALFAAAMFAEAAACEADAFAWWDIHNGIDTNYNLSPTLHGWREYADYGVLATDDITAWGGTQNEPYPVYYGLKILTNFARPGDRLVEVSNNYPRVLSTYACLDENSNSLSVLVINKSPDSGLRPQFSISGFTAGSNATMYTYGLPEDSNRTGITVRNLEINPSAPSAICPAYSVSVIRF